MTIYYTIPTTKETSNFTQVTNLDGSDYELDFKWNSREDRWYLSISLDGERLVSGIKIVSTGDFFKSLTDPRLPDGRLGFINLLEGEPDPGLRNLPDGTLYFIPRSELG